MMNEKYFESAEFYQKRFHNFASLWVVPCFLLLLFVVGFSVFAKKEVTLSSRGTIEATRVVDQIQSTSNSPIQVNHLKENKEKKRIVEMADKAYITDNSSGLYSLLDFWPLSNKWHQGSD